MHNCRWLGFLPAIFVVFAVFTGVVYASEESNKPESVVIAKVNGTDVGEDQVLHEIELISSQMRQQMSPEQFAQRNVQLFREGLNRCIDSLLLDKAAMDEKVEVPEKDINDRISQFRNANRLQEDDAFQQFCEKNDISQDELKETIREQMLHMKIIESHTEEVEAPSEEAIEKFYNDNRDKFASQDEVRASHILLKVEQNESDSKKTELKKQLEDIKSQIEQDKITFADAAKKHSSCPSSARGGDLGSFGRGRMVPPFEQAAFGLEVGKLSDIVETQFGYHLITVTDRTNGEIPTLEQTHDNIKQHLEMQQKQDAILAYLESLREKATVEELVTAEEWNQRHGAIQ